MSTNELTKLGQQRQKARDVAKQKTEALAAATVRAIREDGLSEAEAARLAQVDRMTVRNWLGKAPAAYKQAAD